MGVEPTSSAWKADVLAVVRHPQMVRVARLERTTSCSRSKRPTNWAIPGYKKWENPLSPTMMPLEEVVSPEHHLLHCKPTLKLQSDNQRGVYNRPRTIQGVLL